ncbi:MAG: hypothetical protein IIB81_05135 [Nanoarchaeota archaeon]|nr:hypothetical protein [Nanoarchaeota archaeon]
MRKLKYPIKYIQRGRFVLHSRQITDVLYDVNELLTDYFYVKHVIHQIPESVHYVGISTGGAEIAGMVAENNQRKHLGQSMAYCEDAFQKAINNSGIHQNENVIIELFRDI